MSDRPKTLYELCERTADAIELAPETYHQDYFIYNRGSDMAEGSCGTSFCRAGWMYTLLQSKPLTPDRRKELELNCELIYEPVEILLVEAGVPAEEVDALFNGAASNEEDAEDVDFAHNYKYHKTLHRLRPGTKAYARAGAKGLREFMRKYEKQLKAASVPKCLPE